MAYFCSMVFVSRLASSLFHPIFVLNYVLILLYLVNPYLFGIQDDRQKGLLFISVFLLSVFFPIFTILVMKLVGFVDSIEVKERKERVMPLVLTSIFYLWLYVNIRQNSIVPEAFSIFVLGATIALFVAFFINNFSKISLHTVGMGGFVAMIFLIRAYFSYDTFYFRLGSLGNYSVSLDFLLFLSIIIAGLVGTARLALNAHRKQDVYMGYLVGFLAQFISFNILT